MMKSILSPRHVLGLAFALGIVGSAHVCLAIDVTFEAPAYTTGNLIGQDGWVQNTYVAGAFFGGPNGAVTVSSASPLEGARSLLYDQTAVTGIGGGVPGASDVSKGQVITVSPVAGIDLSASYLISASGNAQDIDGRAGVFLSHDAFGGLSPIFARLNGAVMEVGNAGSPGGIAVVPDFTYFPGDVLKVTYDVDFDTSTYDVSVTNQTFGGFEFTQTFNFLGAFAAEGPNSEYIVDVGTLLRSGTAKIDSISLTAGTGPIVTDFAWNIDGSGNWNQSINWAPQGVPGSRPGLQTALFGSTITSNQTVYNNSSRSLNRVEFDNTNSYFIAGTGSIELESDTSGGTPVNPTIEVANGHHVIQLGVNLLDDATVTAASGASLDFNNQIDLNGNTLTVSGDVRLNHSTIGGGTVMNLGGLAAADSTEIDGNLVSLGELIIGAGSQSADSFSVSGDATLNGVLDVVLESALAPGTSYTVVSAGGRLDASGLTLDSSDSPFFRLSTSDHALTLTYVSAVPEPGGLLLIASCAVALVFAFRVRRPANVAPWLAGFFAVVCANSASAVTIDFENPPYTAGSIIGQQGWVRNAYVGAPNVNGDVNISATAPIGGSQSFEYTQTSVPVGFGAADVSKPFVAFGTADGTTAVDLTATVQLKADANSFAAGQVGVFLSGNAFNGLSPIGVRIDGANSTSGTGNISVLHTTGFVSGMPYVPNHTFEFQIGVNFDNGGDYEVAVRDVTAGGSFTNLVGPSAGGRFGFFNAPNVFPADGDGVTYTVDVGTLLRGGVGQIDNLTIEGDEFTQALWQGVSGDWAQNTNWIPQLVPNASTGNGQIAIFGNRNIAPQTVFANSNQTVNGLRFDSPNKYALAGGGTIQLKANTGDVTVNPTISVLQGSHEVQSPVSILNDTTVTVATGAQLDVNSDVALGGRTVTTSGSLNLNVGVSGGGAISNSGILGTAGSTPITANLISTGTLRIDLGAANTDRFDVTGSATLSGLLDVVLEPSFTPSGSYTVLTASGTLNASGLTLDPSDTGAFQLSVAGNSLILTASAGLPGDYNGDSAVDAADFVVWRKNPGAFGGNPGGYNTWQDNFGEGGSGGGQGAVPEPTSVVLGMFALALLTAMRPNGRFDSK